MNNNALVLFSGGQDSTTCLLWALSEFDSVSAVSFDYDQRHVVELAQAQIIIGALRERYGPIPHVALPLPALAWIGAAALTDPDVAVEEQATNAGGNAYAAERGLPSTFVPGRNIVLLGTAAALAAKLGADNLVTGICATDRAGYPDCRAEFAASIEATLRVGLDWPRLRLHTPVLWRTKADTWALADEVAGPWGVELVRSLSHTCYEGNRESMHPWGHGCGTCPACQTRAAGWDEFSGAVSVR